MKDAIVKFEEQGRRISIGSIDNPKIYMFGRLQAKGKGLTFIPYDSNIDEMMVQ